MNGYKNYETWAVALWLENTEADYNHYRRAYADLAKAKGRDEAIGYLADLIRDEITDRTPLTCGLYADLLNAALNNVDWHEVAERFGDD